MSTGAVLNPNDIPSSQATDRDMDPSFGDMTNRKRSSPVDMCKNGTGRVTRQSKSKRVPLAQRVASKSPKQTNVLKKPVPESKRGKKRAKLADPEFAVEELPLPRVQPRPHASEAAKAPHVTPFDRLEDEDPIYVREYVEDIFIYLKEMEVSMMPSADCMNTQQELTWGKRAVLVEWMVEVHEAFRLLPETLLLAVNMLDRLLSLRRVSETRLQLLGVTALFIAAKFEEIATPSISHFAGATAEAFTTEDIVVAESYMLTVLEYRLGWPSPLSFLRRISKADGYRTKIRNLCKYMVEEALLMGKGWVGVMPSSKVAAAAFWMARKMDNSQPWHANMKFYSGYEEKELETAVRLLFLHFKQNEVNAQSDKHTAVYRKWSNSAHMRISHVVAEWFADFDDFNELWQV